ncbi:MAG: CBS domain-containing protein [Candidatus Odinarchaeum yellowstonii]|uniref:CBS domain-containing protein n=1 Tax=Odinarchaeota yellowstonii (strain LCB_4) TaxID=1841599 RepID=A0AAF0IBH0_ODILC|nr:MAG: CBS domain-containing protein [Candidatus Odinarchaeum yellowstonii]
MKINEIMKSPVVTCGENDTIARVRNLMLNKNVSRIIIIDRDEKPIGIITQKDIIRILNKSTPVWRRRSLDSVTVKNYMSKPLITESPEVDVINAVLKLKETGFSSLPIVSGNKLVGILSKTDIVQALPKLLDARIQVKQFMKTPVVTAKKTHSIHHIYDLMREHNISRVVIVERNSPIGIITASDLIFVKPKALITGLTERGEALREPEKITRTLSMNLGRVFILAEEIMSKDPIVVSENQSVLKAAEYMTRYNVSGLPVVDGSPNKILVGIITKRDIINHLAEVYAKK